jgi:hypothetical protein
MSKRAVGPKRAKDKKNHGYAKHVHQRPRPKPDANKKPNPTTFLIVEYMIE